MGIYDELKKVEGSRVGGVITRLIGRGGRQDILRWHRT